VTIWVFPLTGNKTETLISCRISKGISQYSSGIDRKQEHIRPSTTHPRLFLGFHQTFPSILPSISLLFHWISLRISWRISQGFHEFRLGHKATEAANNICSTMGEDVLSTRTAQHWFNRFKNGNFELDDLPRSSRPIELNVDLLKQLIE
jgi:hypothetical protein